MKRYLWLLILVCGILLRWAYLDWSLPHVFHPDETRLLYAVQEISWDDLNPKFFAYGSLPIYLLKIINTVTESVLRRSGQSAHISFFWLGRATSAFFGSLTLLIVYLLGTQFFSRRVGLIALAFLTFTVLHIQLSHFLTVDVLLTFFIVATFYFLASLVSNAERDTSQHAWQLLCDYGLAAVMIGMALATKISAAPLYGVFLVAHLLALRQHGGSGRPRRRDILGFWGLFLGALLLSGVVFFSCQPYVFLEWKEFLRQVKEQSDMVRGAWQPPYVLQYEQTTPYWYQLTQLIHYSMGWPLGIVTLLGTLALALRTLLNFIRPPLHSEKQTTSTAKIVLLALAWVVPVFALVGGFEVKFMRYMLPLIPFFCLLGAVWIDRLITQFPRWQVLVYAITAFTLIFSLWYALAFLAVYRRDDPRKQASQWIVKHVEKDAGILTELWEFAPVVSIHNYRIDQLDLYATDSEEKIRAIARKLSDSEVIVLATKRIYGSVLRVPQRFPLTAVYYRLLFDGELGYAPVKVFTSYPSCLGITLRDDFADESFSVYDHPKTILFRKTESLSAQELYNRILNAPPVTSPSQLLQRLLAYPEMESGIAPHVQDTRVVAPLPTSAPSPIQASDQWKAIFFWLLAVELLALAALPVSLLAFRKLPDVGYGISKLLGMLLPAYFAWLLVSLKFAALSRGLLLTCSALFALVTLAIAVRYHAFLQAVFRKTWKVFLVEEGIFLAAFAAFLLFRAYNPDIFWSESSMDFSFLNVLVRTDALPPPDPWISGFPLNYYYFGHYLVAVLSKLTGILPQISYNLAFALFPALVVLEAFSLLYNLTRRYLYGVVGGLFSSVIGNLDGFFLLRDMLRGKESTFRFFRCAHEVIPHTIHEFPFWTFIFVDLHAHLLNMPVLLAIFLAGLHLLYESPYSDSPVAMRQLKQTATLQRGTRLLIALLLGTLAVISSWDYPTAGIFLLLITLVRVWIHRRSRWKTWRRALRPVLEIVVMCPVSLLCYTPFFLSFSRQGMGIGRVGGATTALPDFLTIFGFFLSIIIVWLVWRLQQLDKGWRGVLMIILMNGAAYILADRLLSSNYATLLFVVALGSLSCYLAVQSTSLQPEPSSLYAWLCVVYACMIVAGCEVIFVKDFLQGGEYKRMNTLFKFYIPAWFLLAFGASYALFQMQTSWQQSSRLYKTGVSRFLRRCGPGAMLTLFLASAVFPVMAVYARRHYDLYARVWLPPTLDGLAFLHAENPDEYQAIRWLNANIPGTPVIAEATGDDYLYEYARISANTGLPTVLGWKSHAEQREHWQDTHQRKIDLKEIYASRDVARSYQLLKRYQVAYVYVGATERRDFDHQALRKFDMASDYFDPVFRSGNTSIYRVR